MALNERTASYLAEEVRKAQTELELARTQRHEAQAREEAAEIKLEALRAAMGPGAPSGVPTFITPSSGQATFFGAAPVVIQTEVAASPEPTFGFRAAIRLVLHDANGKGLRAGEVYERIAARGIVYKGKTNPTIRTGNELRRMTREGFAKKRGKLFYALNPSEQIAGGTTQ
jgi:hypothetical protein